jgi:transcriptional regulator with XRE-family HTH domain
MDGERLGRRVRAFRKLKRIPQATLATQLNISTTNLGRIERGEKIPSEELLQQIANSLEINQQELIGEEFAE